VWLLFLGKVVHYLTHFNQITCVQILLRWFGLFNSEVAFTRLLKLRKALINQVLVATHVVLMPLLKFVHPVLGHSIEGVLGSWRPEPVIVFLHGLSDRGICTSVNSYSCVTFVFDVVRELPIGVDRFDLKRFTVDGLWTLTTIFVNKGFARTFRW
jgi:hypothetical protein